MDNKKDGKLDYRNIKQTQFDPGQVSKMTFSEISSATRVTGINSILKDTFTHFVQVLDADDNITKVNYYQAVSPAIDEIQVVADVSASLRSTYITLFDFLTQKEYVFYFKVDSMGAKPNTGDFQIAVDILENDPASVVCLALNNAILSVDNFAITRKSILSNSFEVEYLGFGEAEAVFVDDSGFTVNRLQEGSSQEVGEITLTYDTDGNVVYNGSTLKGLVYNPFSASFDVNTVYTVPPIEAEGSTAVELVANPEFESMICLLGNILTELKIMNLHNNILTENEITKNDLD